MRRLVPLMIVKESWINGLDLTLELFATQCLLRPLAGFGEVDRTPPHKSARANAPNPVGGVVRRMAALRRKRSVGLVIQFERSLVKLR
jgi:DNA helicase HerA-like ATPase